MFEKVEVADMVEEAHKQNAMKPATIYKWVKGFQEGRENVEDQHRVILLILFEIFYGFCGLVLYCNFSFSIVRIEVKAVTVQIVVKI